MVSFARSFEFWKLVCIIHVVYVRIDTNTDAQGERNLYLVSRKDLSNVFGAYDY